MVCCSDDPPKRVVGENAGSYSCTDLLFALLFILNLVPLVILFAEFKAENDISDRLNSTFGYIAREEFDNDLNMVGRAGGYALLGAVPLVVVWLAMCYIVPTLLIISTFLLMITMSVAIAISLFANPDGWDVGETEATIIAAALLLFALLNVLWIWCIRKQIAFTATVLKSVSAILLRMPELLLIQLGMSGAALGVMALWGGSYIELLALMDEYDHEHDTNAAAVGYWAAGNIWALISLFWVQFTLVNIAVVTACATVGAWYFSPSAFGDGCFGCRPPVWWGLLRALTFNFGSIAFGSLVLAIMRTIIVVVQYLAKKAESQGGMVAKCACCCLICCLKCIEGTLNWLTEYAFVYVAIYGVNFCSAGQKVFSLLGKAGAQAVIQTSLITPLLWLSSALGLAVGCLCGWGAHQQVGSDGLSDDARHLQLAVALVSGGAVGYLVMTIGVNVVIGAGCKTLLVCFTEEPEHLKDSDPALYEAFSGKMPQDKGTTSSTSAVGVVVP